MKRETKPLRLILTAVLVLAVLALVVFTAAKLLQFGAATQTQTAKNTPDPAIREQTRLALEEDGVLVWKGVRYVRRRGLETYLILGVDRSEAQIASGITNGQADVQLLLVIDPRESRYRILQLNRDMVSQVNVVSPSGYVSGSLFKPICLAYAYASGAEAGCENTVNSVRYLLQDTPIDGYAAVSLEAIGTLNDAVGGVTVTIRGDMTATDPSFTDGATVTLNAQTAERFVRARMELGQKNEDRMVRHQQYMAAWLETARTKSAQDAQFAMRLLRDLEPIMTTDMTEKRLSGIASDVGKYEYEGILTIDGEYRTVDGFQYYYADEDSLMETVIELFYTVVQ